MTLLLFCAVGWALGMSVNVFGLGLALVVTACAAMLMNVHGGVAASLWTAISITTWLQIGYVGGIASRWLSPRGGAIHAKGALQRPRG